MTSTAPANPQEPQSGSHVPLEPVIWLHTRPRAVARPAGDDGIAGLTWPLWAPSTPVGREHLGEILLEFAAVYPGRPLLLLAPGLILQAQDAKTLAAIASQCGEPAVLSMLSNARRELNPFAGLDVSHLQQLDAEGQHSALEHMAKLVRLLGKGNLHLLDTWPGHLLFFSVSAIELLAHEQVTTATALSHLQRHGGRLAISDSLFAASAGHAYDYGPELQAHEERRAAPWGDLTANLAQWLATAASAPENPASDEAPSSLHITHSWGGGVAQWVQSFIEADRQECHFQLRSEGPQSGLGAGQRLSLYAGNELKAPLAVWWLNPPIRSSSEENSQYREILDSIQRRHGIGRIIVSSLVGHSLDALRTGLPTMQVLHDFYPGWPLLGVHPAPWLAVGREQRLQQAMQQHELLPDLGDRDASSWNRLADGWVDALSRHEVKLVAPSESAAHMLRQLDCRWQDIDIKIIHHGLAPLPVDGPVVPRPRKDGKLRLVIPGRIQEAKGQSLLLAALPQLTRHAQVYLLGAGKHGEEFFGQAGVNVILQYERKDLPRLMRTIGADAAALLSVVPETFSYTLSEMQQLGIPVIATRVGSLSERIHDGRDGWLIDPKVDALVRMVSNIAADRSLLDSVRSNLRSIEHFSAADMVQHYRNLCAAEWFEPDLSGDPGTGRTAAGRTG